jgi:hypothetical protein
LNYCKNCGRLIGDLETPYVWRDSVVCATCFNRLSPSEFETLPTVAGQSPMNPVSFAPPPPPIAASPRRKESGVGRTILLQLVVFGMFWLGFYAGEWWDDRQRSIQNQSVSSHEASPAPEAAQSIDQSLKPQPNPNN